jgi:alpha-tubulin suppressor-like RCC1 family protein
MCWIRLRRLHHTPRMLPALAASIIACSPTEPAAPTTKLVFMVQPVTATGAQLITPAVQVAVQDASGNTVTTATDEVTIGLGANTVGGKLTGTLRVTAIQGIATFSDLRIDRPGSGYTLNTNAAGRSGATSASFPVRLTFTDVSAGGPHTCGLTTPSATYCWGGNAGGALGDTTTASWPSPVLVAGGVTFTAVSAGYNHTCGLTAAGVAYCWGNDSNGEVGDGLPQVLAITPTPVAGGLSFAAVSTGWLHTCGVTLANAAYCWGANSSGELGDGTTIQRFAPAAVAGGVSFTAVSSSAYFGHTCGLTAAGAAYCWGSNVYGQLGDGTTIDRLTPGLVAGGLSFTAVSAGGFQTCGLTSAGAVYCWGNNSNGGLGDGTTTNRPSPVLVVGGLSFATMSAGNGQTCGLTSAGAVYCWGYNTFGQVGDGTTTDRSTPVLVAGGLSFAVVSAGLYHTCGVTDVGAAYCWGMGGMVGDGSTTQRLTPTRVVQ